MTRTSIALYKADFCPPDQYVEKISKHPVGASVSLKRNTFLHVTEDTFSIVTSDFIGGTNIHSGKHWFRWRKDVSIFLSLKKKGADGTPRPYLYHFVRSPKFFGNISANPLPFVLYLEAYPEIIPPLREFLDRHGLLLPDAFPLVDTSRSRQKYSVDMLHLMFPMLRIYGAINDRTNTNHAWFGILSPALRERTLEGYARKLFGAKRYRKDLVKALAKAPLFAHSRAASAVGLVPMDWIIEGLRAFADDAPNTPDNLYFTNVFGQDTRKAFRTFLRDCPYHLRRRHVNSNCIANPILMQEVYMWRQHRAFEIDYRKSITEIHDDWVTEFRPTYNQRTRTPLNNKEDPIPEIPQTKKIAEISVPGYEIVPAKTRGDMQKWSEEMHNCISGYYSTAADPNAEATYLGIYRDGALFANVEIRKGVVKQFLGKYNKTFSDERFEEVTPILEEWLKAGVVKNDFRRTWGFDGSRANDFVVRGTAIRMTRLDENGNPNEVVFNVETDINVPEDEVWFV